MSTRTVISSMVILALTASLPGCADMGEIDAASEEAAAADSDEEEVAVSSVDASALVSLRGALQAESRTINSVNLANGTVALNVRYVFDFDLVWNDRGSGASRDGEFYKPILPAGYYAIGHYGQNYYGTPTRYTLAVQPVDPTAIALPVGYRRVWTDKGSGAKLDGSFWEPSCPNGYYAMGSVAQRNWNVPSQSAVVCLRADLIAEGRISSLIWNDRDSGADADVSIWRIAPVDGTGLGTGCFFAYERYDEPYAAVNVLDKSRIRIVW